MIKTREGNTHIEGSKGEILADIGIIINSTLDAFTKDTKDPLEEARESALQIMNSIMFVFDKYEEKLEAPLFPPIGYIGDHKKPKLDKELKKEFRDFVKEILKEDD